jgi:hypothetical protein
MVAFADEETGNSLQSPQKPPMLHECQPSLPMLEQLWMMTVYHKPHSLHAKQLLQGTISLDSSGYEEDTFFQSVEICNF